MDFAFATSEQLISTRIAVDDDTEISVSPPTSRSYFALPIPICRSSDLSLAEAAGITGRRCYVIQEIKTLDQKKVKTCGISFGHQAIAKALGGDVQKNPKVGLLRS